MASTCDGESESVNVLFHCWASMILTRVIDSKQRSRRRILLFYKAEIVLIPNVS